MNPTVGETPAPIFDAKCLPQDPFKERRRMTDFTTFTVESLPSPPLWSPSDTQLPHLQANFVNAPTNNDPALSAPSLFVNEQFQGFLQSASKNQGSFATAFTKHKKEQHAKSKDCSNQSDMRRSLVGLFQESALA